MKGLSRQRTSFALAVEEPRFLENEASLLLNLLDALPERSGLWIKSSVKVLFFPNSIKSQNQLKD